MNGFVYCTVKQEVMRRADVQHGGFGTDEGLFPRCTTIDQQGANRNPIGEVMAVQNKNMGGAQMIMFTSVM